MKLRLYARVHIAGSWYKDMQEAICLLHVFIVYWGYCYPHLEVPQEVQIRHPS